jgi:hypothetical protein
MPKTARERRAKQRSHFSLPIRCANLSFQELSDSVATTYDLSEKGICFYSDVPFETGRVIQISIQDFCDVPRYCNVRWCSKKGRKFYKVGVLFD